MKAKNKNTSHAGFTLIELLVVISIIGLLASVVLVSLNSARVKARDARRAADMRQLATALEMYYDQNNSYPACVNGGANTGGDDWCGGCSPVNQSEFIGALQPLVNAKVISKIPVDPLGQQNGCYNYEYHADPAVNTYNITCGGQSVTNFAYVIRFSTEQATNLGFPESNNTRPTGKEYCMTAAK